MKLLLAVCLLVSGVSSANYGESGIVYPDGTLVQFTPDEAANIQQIGPAGVVKYDGNNVQLNSDGVPARKKRSESQVLLKGPSAVMFKDGQKRQLAPGVDIAVEGPSGVVFTDGTNVQFRKKRAIPTIEPIIAPSGFITPTGQLIPLPPGVTVAILGDTGALLSDGKVVQFYE